MMDYKECPACHCSLDPGEKCDCDGQEKPISDNPVVNHNLEMLKQAFLEFDYK